MTQADFAEMLRSWNSGWAGKYTVWESPDKTVRLGLAWWRIRDLGAEPGRSSKALEVIEIMPTLSRKERRALRRAMRAEASLRTVEARKKYDAKARKHIEIMAGAAPKHQMVEHMLTSPKNAGCKHEELCHCEIGFGG